MIGLDTNVLLRAFVNDDPAQGATAREMIARSSAEMPLRICSIVLVEFTWSLRRTFHYTPAQVREVIRQIMETSDIVMESREVVEDYLDLSARTKVDLADVLIAGSNRDAGCSTTMTFDRDGAARIPAMELLA